MKIAITGATGHVGANLCRELVSQGHQVKALIHHSTKAIKDIDVERIDGSLSDPSSLNNLCRDAEVVFHLAAMISIEGQREKLMKTNVEGTKNLLTAFKANHVKRLIHFSSIHALSHFPLDERMDESRPLVETSPMMYEVTKSMGEKIVRAEIANGLDGIIINPTAIIGPNDYKPSLVGQVLIRLYKGTLPALVPGGYDWVDVRDITKAVIQAIDHGKKGDRYILSGNFLSVKDFAQIVQKVTGKQIVKRMVPTALAKVGVPFISLYSAITGKDPLYTNESLKILLSGNHKIASDKARKELGFNPRPTEDSVRDAIEWFRENHYID
jgi:dihydroflavonol-4-reductase